jgi:hypothetical protein
MKVTYYIKSSKESNDSICITIKKGLLTTHYAYALWGEHSPASTVTSEVCIFEQKNLIEWVIEQGYTYTATPVITP